VADLLGVARRDIEVSKNMINTELDWAFAIAYNSILQLTLAWMYHLGYRPRGEAKHVNTFRFLEEALPKEKQPMIKRLQKMRKKRNAAIYRQRGLVSEKEAHDVIDFAERYYKEIEGVLPDNIKRLSRKED
ncbi:MAG: HEPN domain-containing protein, partial [Actinobacteria bacterium]|nr:HEPN domain-containing protein [Actinomycetota bacterium]